MGTSNFIYRDSLYVLEAHAPDFECTCDADAIADGCEHEADCPATEYHESFIDDYTYNETCRSIMQYLRTCDTTATVFDVDEWTNDNRNFDGPILGRAYYNLDNCKTGIYGIEVDFDLAIGDDYCLRVGYYGGANFDRTTCRLADYGCDELEALSDDIYERLVRYDELYVREWIDERVAEVNDGSHESMADACDTYGVRLPDGHNLLTVDDTDWLFAYITKFIYDICMDNVTKAVEEMDTIYHTLGGKYFEQYGVVARFGNGETWYTKSN